MKLFKKSTFSLAILLLFTMFNAVGEGTLATFMERLPKEIEDLKKLVPQIRQKANELHELSRSLERETSDVTGIIGPMRQPKKPSDIAKPEQIDKLRTLEDPLVDLLSSSRIQKTDLTKKYINAVKKLQEYGYFLQETIDDEKLKKEIGAAIQKEIDASKPVAPKVEKQFEEEEIDPGFFEKAPEAVEPEQIMPADEFDESPFAEEAEDVEIEDAVEEVKEVEVVEEEPEEEDIEEEEEVVEEEPEEEDIEEEEEVVEEEPEEEDIEEEEEVVEEEPEEEDIEEEEEVEEEVPETQDTPSQRPPRPPRPAPPAPKEVEIPLEEVGGTEVEPESPQDEGSSEEVLTEMLSDKKEEPGIEISMENVA